MTTRNRIRKHCERDGGASLSRRVADADLRGVGGEQVRKVVAGSAARHHVDNLEIGEAFECIGESAPRPWSLAAVCVRGDVPEPRLLTALALSMAACLQAECLDSWFAGRASRLMVAKNGTLC